jgi:hypothetical protein
LSKRSRARSLTAPTQMLLLSAAVVLFGIVAASAVLDLIPFALRHERRASSYQQLIGGGSAGIVPLTLAGTTSARMCLSLIVAPPWLLPVLLGRIVFPEDVRPFAS